MKTSLSVVALSSMMLAACGGGSGSSNSSSQPSVAQSSQVQSAIAVSSNATSDSTQHSSLTTSIETSTETSVATSIASSVIASASASEAGGIPSPNSLASASSVMGQPNTLSSVSVGDNHSSLSASMMQQSSLDAASAAQLSSVAPSSQSAAALSSQSTTTSAANAQSSESVSSEIHSSESSSIESASIASSSSESRASESHSSESDSSVAHSSVEESSAARSSVEESSAGLSSIGSIASSGDSSSLAVQSSLAASSLSSLAPASAAASSASVNRIITDAALETQITPSTVIRAPSMQGYAAHAQVTGGSGGTVVRVSSGTDLNKALCRADRSSPITILVEGIIEHSNTTAEGCDTQADVIEIKKQHNISIIGVGEGAIFDQIGIHLRDASNIILQNLHVRNVKKSGSPTSNGGDSIGIESGVNRVWIDHNTLEASGGEKDGYDSLLDMKAGVTNVTVSYNLFRDSSRAGLIGSSDSDDENHNITFHHNWYKNIEQRTPLIRHANVHTFNNLWSNAFKTQMIHGINVRMNARALVESNYFHNTNNPLLASDDSSVPGCWVTNNDNTVTPEIYYSRTLTDGALVLPAIVDGQLQTSCNPSEQAAAAVPYAYSLDAAADIPAIVMANAGAGIIQAGQVSNSSAAPSSVAVSSAVQSAGASSSGLSSSGLSSGANDPSLSSETASSNAATAGSWNANAFILNSGYAKTSGTATYPNGNSVTANFHGGKIESSKEGFFFINQTVIGDFTLTANLASVANATANNNQGQIGLAFCANCEPGGAVPALARIGVSGSFTIFGEHRLSAGASRTGATVTQTAAQPGANLYLRLARVGNTYTSFYSLNGGSTWTQYYQATFAALPASLRVGFYGAHGTDAANSFTFNNIVLQAASMPPVSASSAAVSSAGASSIATSVSSSQLSSVISSAAISSSAMTSSAVSSSVSSVGVPSQVNLSEDCIRLSTNASVNWRDTSLQTDQAIVECLYQSLGRPVGYGENAHGGYDANGNSTLTVIKKNIGISVEQQLLNALTDNSHNWIVFDKVDFAQPHEIGMYRSFCSNPTVLSLLDASETECNDYQQWCDRKGFTNAATCQDEFFNKAMNKQSIPIRIPAVGSNKTLDGRLSQAYFLFSGFAIGKDADGVATQTSESVIFTHLEFRGAGHVEDHYVDPDMIRSTGASHDIWIHKNTFDTTGDSAFDVKIGANSITMSFNRLINVKRAVLHGSSDSRTINANITTTMHHNAFVTTDDSYLTLGNTLRRVPLLRRGKTHMTNNLFVNYRKEVLSLRVGASAWLEDNIFVNNIALKEKSSLEASLSEVMANLLRDISGGNLRNDDNYLVFGSSACILDESTRRQLTASNGTVADLDLTYSQLSRDKLSDWKFSANQDLVNYVTHTAGKNGATPFNSPLSFDRIYMQSLTAVNCQ